METLIAEMSQDLQPVLLPGLGEILLALTIFVGLITLAIVSRRWRKS